MDDIKLIIYIVLGILFFVIKTISRNKSKQKRAGISSVSQTQPDKQQDIKDLFDEFINTEKNKTVQEPLNNSIQKNNNLVITEKEKASVKGKVILNDDEEELFDEFKFDHSEMKKAVIYSEILNRKEY